MPTLTFRPLGDEQEVEVCARMMAQSEPWKTLRRDYEMCRRTVSDPTREVYVALTGEDKAEIAGFAILNMKGAFVGYIQTLCVAPERRGQGTGTALLRFAEDRILGEVPNVFMCVSSFNEGAQRLYARLGYTVVGELKDYIVSGHSEILLRKSIAPLSEFRPSPQTLPR
ncbi:MAG TPA: N-acetyltransferase [Chloroflexia bacterium]|nr:N-acetyltransferase [Chloroflexia bacterium]